MKSIIMRIRGDGHIIHLKKNTSDGSYSAKYIDNFFQKYAPELKEQWHYLHLHETSYGMTSAAFNEVVQTEDYFLTLVVLV